MHGHGGNDQTACGRFLAIRHLELQNIYLDSASIRKTLTDGRSAKSHGQNNAALTMAMNRLRAPPLSSPSIFRLCGHAVFSSLSAAVIFTPPPLSGGLDLDSRSSGCARLGGEVGPPFGVVVEEVAIFISPWRLRDHPSWRAIILRKKVIFGSSPERL